MRIGYIGLGVMGHSMAGHLLQKFGALTIWNRTAAKGDDLVAGGARFASSPAELARESDVVCVCVSDTPDVEQVVFGEEGAAAALGAGSVIVDFSTISATATEEFAARLAELGATWVDAPVSGGDVGARNASLTIMAGGDETAFRMILPVLQAVGRNITHMGPVGSGQRTKIANQIAVAGTIASMAEAMIFARAKGMDVEKVLSVIGSGAAGSWSLSNYGPRLLRDDYAPGFAVSLMAKDMRLVLESLEGIDAPFEVVRLMAEVYEKMLTEGEGGLGNHAAALQLGWKKTS